jgi:radical SAM protein with 4Fe4S-binding SPASM domain
MCYSENRQKGFMAWSLYAKILQELPDLNVGQVTLHYGGESLLHPNFVRMLEAITADDKRKYSVGWFTNGMLFTEEIAKTVVAFGVDWITFSMDGLGEVNDNIRIGAKYEQVERNLLRLLSVRGNRKKPKISINMTDQGQDTESFCEQWINKVDYITVNFYIPSDFRIEKLAAFHNEDSKLTQTRRNCYNPFSDLAILWNGDVMPCCHDWQGRNVMGNLLEGKISEIWKNQRFKQLRKACLRNDFADFPQCQKCNVWKYSFKPSLFIRDDMKITLEGTTQKIERNA